MKKSTNCFFYISLISALFILFSCSTDDVSNLGRSIIEDRSQGGLQIGEFKTIQLSPIRFGSVVDSLSGTHTYEDYLRNRGFLQSRWAIGNWEKDTTIFKLHHFSDEPKDASILRISDILHRLVRDTAIDSRSIRAQLVWNNLTELNSHDNINIEVGVIHSDTTNSNPRFFPLNFALVNPKSNTNTVPLTIESYLLRENVDSTIISRFDARFTNWVDTVVIDTTFRKNTGGVWGDLPGIINVNIKRDTASARMSFASDTLVGWRQLVPAALFHADNTIIDPSVNDTTSNGNTTTIRQNLTLRNRDGVEVAEIEWRNHLTTEADWVLDGSEYLRERTVDTLIIRYTRHDTLLTFVQRGQDRDTIRHYVGNTLYNESVIRDYNRVFANDSTIRRTRLTSGINPLDNTPKPDTLIQIGNVYKTALNTPRRQIRSSSWTGGDGNLANLADADTLSHELVMYLRVRDTLGSRGGVIHITEPLLNISWTPTNSTTRTGMNIRFTDISVIARSADNLQDSTDANNRKPIISGAMQRFAKIDLDFSKFFDTITDQRFLHIGLANLHLPIDAANTDFLQQYGDSIPIYALITEEELTPKSLFALSSTERRPRRINVNGRIHRNSNMLNIPIVETINDFVRYHEIHSKPAPQNAFLYLWLDGHRMGRVLFDESRPINFTYILQTRRDGE